MYSHPMSADLFAGGESKASRGWLIFAGIALLVLGIAAVIYDSTATIISVILFGWLLIIAGVTQIVHAFQFRAWSGFFLFLLEGILRTAVGAILLAFPGSGALTLTLVLSFYFIVGGFFKAISAMALQFPRWGWTVFSGLVAVALGMMLALHWPSSGTWFIGFAVGVELILDGWSLLMFGSVTRKGLKSMA